MLKYLYSERPHFTGYVVFARTHDHNEFIFNVPSIGCAIHEEAIETCGRQALHVSTALALGYVVRERFGGNFRLP